MRRLSWAAGLVATGIALGITGGAPAQEPEVTLTVHHFIGPTAPTHARFVEPWARRIEEQSDGRIKVEIYPSMALGGAPPELIQPGARRRRRHRLDPARLHARCVPALRGVRAADRASRQRGGDLARNPGRVRSDRAGLRGRAPDPDLRACRPGAPYGRQADPQGRGSGRAEAAHPVAHRRDADRGLGRAAGRHAGARAAPGAVEERGRRRAGALRDRAAAQGP